MHNIVLIVIFFFGFFWFLRSAVFNCSADLAKGFPIDILLFELAIWLITVRPY